MKSTLRYEWDEAKAASNVSKHGVSFDEARTVFLDVFALRVFDGPHSSDEDRFIIIGMSDHARVLTVVYVERTEETMRLISARRATSRERRIYEEKTNV